MTLAKRPGHMPPPSGLLPSTRIPHSIYVDSCSMLLPYQTSLALAIGSSASQAADSSSPTFSIHREHRYTTRSSSSRHPKPETRPRPLHQLVVRPDPWR